jgi:plastocyanin
MQPTNDQPIAGQPETSKKEGPPSKGLMITATVLLVLLVAGIAGWLAWRQMQPADQGEGADVTISQDGLSPTTIKVSKGSVVTWTNNDKTAHQILGDADNTEINSAENLNLGDSYSYQFDTAGTYTYHDPLNPNNFKGTVIVE